MMSATKCKYLGMELVGVIVGSLAALVTAWVTTRDLGLRRRMESIDRFLAVAATAQARARESGNGTSEQVAAIELLAELGIRTHDLREGARAALTETVRWSSKHVDDENLAEASQVVHERAVSALARLDAERPPRSSQRR